MGHRASRRRRWRRRRPWGGGRGNGPERPARTAAAQSRRNPAPQPGPLPPRLCPAAFGTGTGIAIVVIAIVVLWLASGFYRVLPDEVGVVLRFGAYNRTTQPGLNYHLPAPIESVLKPSVTRINRTEIGYPLRRRGDACRHQPRPAGRSADADRRRKHRRHQLHGVLDDQGRAGLPVQHPRPRRRRSNRRPRARCARSSARPRSPQALAEGRGKIETDTADSCCSRLLDSYGAGIEVTQVQLQQGRSAGPGHRRVPRRAARARRPGAAAQRGRGLPQRHPAAGARRRRPTSSRRPKPIARDHRPRRGRRRPLPSRSIKAFKVAQGRDRCSGSTSRRWKRSSKNSNKIIIDKAAEGQSGVLPYLPLPNLLSRGRAAAAPAPTPRRHLGGATRHCPPSAARRPRRDAADEPPASWRSSPCCWSSSAFWR